MTCYLLPPSGRTTHIPRAVFRHYVVPNDTAVTVGQAVEDDAPELFVANAATQMMGACQRCGLDMHDDDARFCKRCGQTLVPPARSSSGTVDPY